MRRRVLGLIAAVVALSSCSTQTRLYDWHGYDDAVYAYTRAADQKSMENLIKVYTRLIDEPGGSRKVPPPGVCADYGYLLLKAGKLAEGKELLMRETVLYPESKPFIDRILKRFE